MTCENYSAASLIWASEFINHVLSVLPLNLSSGRENHSTSLVDHIMETAEYAFAFPIGLVLFLCHILTKILPRKPPKVKNARSRPHPSPPPPEVPEIVEPYSEEAIVSSMTKLYNILINLEVISPDHITYPPDAGMRSTPSSASLFILSRESFL